MPSIHLHVPFTLVKARLMRYAMNCPPVIRSPFVLTSAPLILAGEASEMYKGAVMEAIPTPRPTKILPIMMTNGVGARAMIKAPARNRESAIKMEGFLPNLSFIQPPNPAPTMAPATAILTIVSLSTVLFSTAVKSSRIYRSAPDMTPVSYPKRRPPMPAEKTS